MTSTLIQASEAMDLEDAAVTRKEHEASDRELVAKLVDQARAEGDLHEGNLLAGPNGLQLIDWGLACRGAAWVEPALLIPRLILEGHTPAQAEALVAQVPAWKSAPPEAVTGLAAVWSLFREFVARYGPEPIRTSRARAAAAGRAWVKHRLS
ncbi:hypothetical protein GCM10023194_47550 [Planotetraspora phitsanulokensis]